MFYFRFPEVFRGLDVCVKGGKIKSLNQMDLQTERSIQSENHPDLEQPSVHAQLSEEIPSVTVTA